MWVNEFLDGQVRRLSNIQRYNTTPRISDESVAEHSYFVALTSLVLCDHLIGEGFSVPTGQNFWSPCSAT